MQGWTADDIPDEGTSFITHEYANEAVLIYANEAICILSNTNLHNYMEIYI